MDFLKKGLDTSTIDDPVFAISKRAQADSDPRSVNATIGSLYDEKGQIVALKSFFEVYDKVDDALKAKYAEGADGNESYREKVKEHVLEGSVALPTDVIATAGGSGAVSLVFKDFLNANDTILLPEIAWGSYKTMAYEYGLNEMTYKIDDFDDLLAKAQTILKTQKKLVIVINSPCHNPTGLSLTKDEWQRLIKALNKLKKPVVILNDIAYIDYAYDLKKARDHFKTFNDISENILVAIAFSISKTMTAYGMRLGALILVHRDKNTLEGIHNAIVRSCRNIWSNTNNAAMIAFAKVMDDKDAFLKEKDGYIKLLKERAELFRSEADALHLAYYRYDEGFFITLKCTDNARRDILHQKLMDDHIYTVKVNKGIRIAICSTPKAKLKGLAQRIKTISDKI